MCAPKSGTAQNEEAVMKTVVGLINDKLEARNAAEELVSDGFPRQSINIMASDETQRGYNETETQEPFFAPNSGYGVLSGGTNSLIGLGVLEKDASFYEEGVNRGGLLIAVTCDDDIAEKAAAILSRHGAIDVDEQAQSWREAGLSGQARFEEEKLARSAANERRGVIPVVEEELQVGKRQVQTGRVRVYSRITEVPVEEEIRLREEHAKVERRPVDKLADEVEPGAFQERSFEIRETAEEPVISKQARVKEEVVVETEASERTEAIRDTLRRTDVEVEKLDEGYGRQERVGAMDDEEFQRHFNATYGQRGERFEETYRSAYHFAESQSPNLMERDWPEVVEDLHQGWERSHPGTWNKVEDAIHFGWDKRRHH
jgi:uncharacterized protein (TIGR02271 family)